MKLHWIFGTTVLAFTGVFANAGDMTFDFASDVQGFQNVTWEPSAPAGWSGLPGTVKMSHASGGWQMMMTKEFSWGPGGGAANQQLEMRDLANLGNSRISFDMMVDGASFPAGVSTWFQGSIVGNSDGSAGWTQLQNIFSVSGWHNANDPALLTMHFDYSFAQLGWQPGDSWFQFWTGSNSDGAAPVNFYLDNVHVYAVPEPGSAAIFGLGVLASLWLRRRQ